MFQRFTEPFKNERKDAIFSFFFKTQAEVKKKNLLIDVCEWNVLSTDVVSTSTKESWAQWDTLLWSTLSFWDLNIKMALILQLLTSVLAACNLIAVKFLLLGLISDLAKEESSFSDLNVTLLQLGAVKSVQQLRSPVLKIFLFFAWRIRWESFRNTQKGWRATILYSVVCSRHSLSWVRSAGDQLKKSVR